MPVDFEPQVQVLRIDLVRGDEPGTDRAERVAALALVPRTAALQLERALGNVVDDAIAGDMRQRVFLGDVAAGRADDDAELDLPVGLFRPARDLDIVVRTLDRAGPFAEHDRLGGERHVALGGVVRIVQADADELAGARDARPDPRGAFDLGQARQVERGDRRETLGREQVASDVAKLGGQRADDAVLIEDAGLFLAARAVTKKFHLMILS